MTGSLAGFAIDENADGALRVELRGEIDFTGTTEISERIRAAVHERRPAAVRVDLSGVTFLDSSGIGVLVAAMRTAQQAGAEFRVDGPAPKILGQLRTVGLVEPFGLDGVVEPSAA